MLTHLQSRWFICFPKLRFSDQRKTPQWQTGLCPNNEKKRRLCKSKPPLHRRVEMCLLYDGFFSFAVVRQDLIFYFFLVGKDKQPNQKHHRKAKYKTDTSADSSWHRGVIISGFIQKGHRHTICKTTRNDKAIFRTDEQARCKAIYNPYYTCHNNIAAQINNDCPQTSSYQNDNTGFNSKPDCQIEEQ